MLIVLWSCGRTCPSIEADKLIIPIVKVTWIEIVTTLSTSSVLQPCAIDIFEHIYNFYASLRFRHCPDVKLWQSDHAYETMLIGRR